MPLITLNIDESIEDKVLEFLNKLPKELVQINEEAMLEDNEIQEEIDDDSIDAEDYFMFIDDDNIMPFEFDLIGDEETDMVFEVHMEFENGRRFFAFYVTGEDVNTALEEEGYFFSQFVIVSSLEDQNIRTSIEELIYNEEFYDAFDELPDSEEEDKNIDGIDPVRLN